MRTRLDLYGFQSGPIVDRVVGVLAERGLKNVRVRHGLVLRASGPGPSGGGWVTRLPQLPGTSSVESVVVRDRALAIFTSADGALARGGEVFTRHFDLRTGRPAVGSLGVFVSTLTAIDAETVGFAMFVLGPREGQFKLGAFDPQPAARWIQGSGGGEPLTVDSRWTAVFGRNVRPRRTIENPSAADRRSGSADFWRRAARAFRLGQRSTEAAHHAEDHRHRHQCNHPELRIGDRQTAHETPAARRPW